MPGTLCCLVTSCPDVSHANYLFAFHKWGWKHQAMNDRRAAYKNSTYKQIGNNESLEDIKVLNSLPFSLSNHVLNKIAHFLGVGRPPTFYCRKSCPLQSPYPLCTVHDQTYRIRKISSSWCVCRKSAFCRNGD